MLEHEQGDQDAADDGNDVYIRCIEEEAKTCRRPIMHHFLEQTEVYKNHLEQLKMLESEERQG